MQRFRWAVPALRQLSMLGGCRAAAVEALAVQPAAVQAVTWTAVPLGPAAGARLAPGLAQFGRTFATAEPSGRTQARDADSKSQDVVEAKEEFDYITDKIPQRPVGIVEGTSYSIIIIAALGFAAAVLYAAVSELLLQPAEYVAYNKTLERVKDDPRVTVRLGEPVHAYGTESRNRAARQRIPHRLYSDPEGRQHVQIQFHLTGPNGRATVNADMFLEGGEWQHNFLYLDVHEPTRQQVVLVRPEPTLPPARI